MRTQITNDHLTVQAIAGSYVVMLGISLPKSKARKLMGFAILRTDHRTGESSWMRGFKTFDGVGDLPAPGVSVSSGEHTRPRVLFPALSPEPCPKSGCGITSWRIHIEGKGCTADRKARSATRDCACAPHFQSLGLLGRSFRHLRSLRPEFRPVKVLHIASE